MPETPKQIIVVVDSDSDFLEWVGRHLENPSVEVITTTSPTEGLKTFIQKDGDLLIAEVQMEPIDGLELLKQTRQQLPNAMVLLNGNLSSTNSVIEAMKLGAYDVLRKESLNFELRSIVENALSSAEQIKIATAEAIADPNPVTKSTDAIIGRSPAMQDVFKLIGRVARADAPVLITGESGVGKEVVANAIHKFSRRTNGEFVAINCAAIPGNLLESELFGHEKGAFTGAVSQRVGRFEQCDGGTLFLDEIGDMPMEVQSKLLRVLQLGEFSRVGGNQTLSSNVRILAATNKVLEREVEENNFREDLFYRLNVVRIHIPPLRQRPEDVLLLANHFLGRQSEYGAGRRMSFSPEASVLLESHSWPGNVRELENTIQRACVLATGNVIMSQDLPLSNAPRTEGGGSAPPGLMSGATALLKAASAEDGAKVLEVAEREILRAAIALGKLDSLGLTAAALKKVREKHGL